jgi:hypothetical protein
MTAKNRYFPDDLLTREEGVAILRRSGCDYVADMLETNTAAPEHMSHNGMELFRWGTLARWADDRRQEEEFGYFADPTELWRSGASVREASTAK